MIYNQDFYNALQQPIKEQYLKLEFYTYDNKYLFEFTQQVMSDIGTLTINSSSPIRRSFTLNLSNLKGQFNFNEDSLIWIDKKIKLYVGLKYKGNITYIPQGVFVLTEPVSGHGMQESRTTINCVDKMYYYTDSRGKIINELTIAEGTSISAAIKILASRTGETFFNFDTITDTVPFEMTYASNDNLFKAMDELAGKANAKIYYDEMGYLRLRKVDLNDYYNYPTVWTFNGDSSTDKFYAGNVRKLDAGVLANHIIVLGGSSQTATCSYELKVTESNPLFSSSPYSIEKIGDFVYFHNNANPDPIIKTVTDAKNRAKYELLNRLGYSEKISLSSAPIWLLDVQDVLEVTDSKNGVEGRFMIDSITMPLSPQLMTIECRKERRVISDWNFI